MWAAADLEVVYIERNPKYHGYQCRVNYVCNRNITDDFYPYEVDIATALFPPEHSRDGAPPDSETTTGSAVTPEESDEGRPQDPPQRWPEEGESVYFTARVWNRGPDDCAGFRYRWTLDGKPLDEGTYDGSVPVDSLVTVDCPWTWQSGEHQIRLELRSEGDPHRSNDALEDYTNALSLYSFIDLGLLDRFKRDTARVPHPTTDSFTEWLQRHRTRMNRMFEQAGSPLRWRFDRLEFLEDGAAQPSVVRSLYDGAFPARFTLADKDWRLGGSGYYDKTEDLDYGYLHEVGHQLGIIDLYRMDVPPEQNQVSHTPYKSPTCLMSGCAHVISTHTALAMASWHGRRRGYFGQYLFDLPAQIAIRFLDVTGQPLDKAQVVFHQKVETPGIGEHIVKQEKFGGITDADGLFKLPNVPVDSSLFWAETGNRLRPNPFGYISNHGENGVFLIRVEKNDMVDWVWFDITEPNLAYWRGQTESATFPRKTNIGRGVTRVLPSDLAEANAAHWACWSQDGIIRVFDDTWRKQVGTASLGMETSGGFDSYLRFPGDTLARWDLRRLDSIVFRARAENRHAFQSCSPWVRIGNHKAGYFEYRPSQDVLNEANGKWTTYTIPVTGDETWKLESHGNPSMAEINYFELHADTWDYGFKLWLDGIELRTRP